MARLWVAGLLGLLAACSSSGAPSPAQTDRNGEACIDADQCAGTLFCRDSSCECQCMATPVQVECVGDGDCAGTKRCVSEHQCGDCTCTQTTLAWSTDAQGSVLESHAAPDQSVLVRLAQAPWLVRFDAAGVAANLTLTEPLDWAQGFAVASDGSLIVGGNELAGTAQNVKLQHLSATGALLAEQIWAAPLAHLTTIAAGADQKIYVGAFIGSKAQVVEVTSDLQPGPSVSSPFDVEVLAVDASRHFLVGSANEPSNLVSQAAILFANQGAVLLPLREQNFIDKNYFAGTSDGRGGWVYAYAQLSTIATGSDYELTVRRVDAQGNQVGDTTSDLFTHTRLVFATLSDSVVQNSWRLPLSGARGDYFDIQSNVAGELVDDVAIGPLSIVRILSAAAQHYTVARLDFPALAKTEQTACSTTAQCSAGACCSGRCTDKPGCEAFTPCQQHSDCLGVCVQPSDGEAGECMPQCTTSNDCGQNLCVNGACLPPCETGSECFSGSCLPEPDAEGTTVSVCAYP